MSLLRRKCTGCGHGAYLLNEGGQCSSCVAGEPDGRSRRLSNEMCESVEKAQRIAKVLAAQKRAREKVARWTGEGS